MARKTLMTNISYDTLRSCYYAVLYSYDANNVAHRHTRCFPTLEEAVQARDANRITRTLAQEQIDPALTLGSWLDYWLEQIARPALAASTIHGYTMIVRNHLIPGLGAVPLRNLTASQIQTYLNGKQREGLCGNTVRKHHCLLHTALERAVQQKLLPVNVSELVQLPPFSLPVHHYYDAETMKLLFKALEGTSIEPMVKLAGYLGLRRSEICALKWSSVDQKAKIITVSEARTAVNGRAVDKGTKNRSSSRRLGYGGIADLEQTIEQLWNKYQWEKQTMGPAYQDSGFLLSHHGGHPYQPDYVSNRLQRLLRQTGLPYITLHGLRHSFASIAGSRNVSLYGISRALGHSTTSTTARIYMHLFDDTSLSVVRQVGEAISDPAVSL